jgi:hypothetical protein
VSALATPLLAVLWLGYILPGDQVVAQLSEVRAARPPLRIEAQVEARDSGAPKRLTIELHPELGGRASDDVGGRWVWSFGRTISGTQLPPPPWLPDLEPLVLRREGDLRSWLTSSGVDLAANELARCGEGDCWVLGTRTSAGQVWIEKPGFEVRRVVRPASPRVAFDQWQEFGKIRFPAKIEISDDKGVLATLTVQSVNPIALSAADLQPSWVQAAPAARAR